MKNVLNIILTIIIYFCLTSMIVAVISGGFNHGVISLRIMFSILFGLLKPIKIIE